MCWRHKNLVWAQLNKIWAYKQILQHRSSYLVCSWAIISASPGITHCRTAWHPSERRGGADVRIMYYVLRTMCCILCTTCLASARAKAGTSENQSINQSITYYVTWVCFVYLCSDWLLDDRLCWEQVLGCHNAACNLDLICQSLHTHISHSAGVAKSLTFCWVCHVPDILLGLPVPGKPNFV